MRVTRVYVEGGLIPGSVLELPADTASHLAKVLRARSGDEIVLFNGDGREFAAAIEAVRGPRVSVAIGDARSVDRNHRLPSRSCSAFRAATAWISSCRRRSNSASHELYPS